MVGLTGCNDVTKNGKTVNDIKVEWFAVLYWFS
jgi:hypothetical protein